MAKAPVDCSELATTLAELSYNFAGEEDVASLDDVTARVAEIVPGTTRKELAESITAYERHKRATAKKGAETTLSKVKREAREAVTEPELARQLEDQIAELQAIIREDAAPLSQRQQKKVRSRAIQQLEANRAALKRLQRQLVRLRNAQLEAEGLDVKAPGRGRQRAEAGVEAVREMADKLQRQINLRQQIDRLWSQLQSGEIELPGAKKRSRFADDPVVERLEIERDRAKGEVRRRQADEAPKSRFHRWVRSPFRLLTNLKATGEFSAVLNQGGFVASGNPLLAGRVYKRALGSLSQMGEARIDRWIEDHPRANQMFRSKLDLTELGGDLTAREEGALSRIVDRIPVLGATNRFHKTFLNLMRVELFDSIVSGMEGSGGPLTLEEERSVANLVNVATGRGAVGKYSQAASFFADFAFAPRWMLSRLQLLVGQPLWSAPSGRVRNAVLKQYARYIVGRSSLQVAMALAAAALNDWKDDEEFAKAPLDPRATDFGRLVVGNTRLDPNAGLQTYLRLAAQVIAGSRVTAEDETVPLRNQFYIGPEGGVPFGRSNAWDTVIRFLEGKSSIAVGTVRSIIAQEDFMGFPLTRETLAKDLAPIPFTYAELYDTMTKDEGLNLPAKVAIGILALNGMFSSTYDPEVESEKRDESKELAKERQERRAVVYEAIRDRIAGAVGQ